MKIKFPISDGRFSIVRSLANRKSQITNRKCEGVALVVTLILLAVVTVMALAFLAVSRRERGAVTTTSDTAVARLAADAALANAEAQIMANVMASTNPYNFGLIVSTNYLPVTTGNSLSDLTNMLIAPRAPVWLSNTVTRAMENRFYLDLNRNGRDEPNGWITNVNASSNVIFITGQIPYTNFAIGDPEWIGGLERPDVPHGPNNHFLYRYAFIALPIGNTLDLNAIHNEAVTKNVGAAANDGYLRNQGIGSWEMNLAGFLADLNLDEWDNNSSGGIYQYNQANPSSSPNTGAAFDDARALLAYRYNFNYANLFSASQLFKNNAQLFWNDSIDEYSDGPLMTNIFLPSDNDQADLTGISPRPSWLGADNMNHYFDMQDLFDTNKTSFAFTNRLLSAGISNATYDRYTFYRLLSQMGVDSAPEQNKINLNYSNAVVNYDANGIPTNMAIISGAETNLVPWRPLDFFTIAADRMLRAYSREWLARDPANYVSNYNMTVSFGITNIPVLVSNKFVYSSAINRVLQLAANIYDATTNKMNSGEFHDWPSVFKPLFRRDLSGNVFISGYETNDIIANLNAEFNLAKDVTDSSVGVIPNVNVYGVPWIIGAKKGFPNFNEFSVENALQVTRKVEVARPTLDAPISDYQTNQQYIFNINSSLGVECWNSYASNYAGQGQIEIAVSNNLSMYLTNASGYVSPFPLGVFNSTTTISNNWPGTWQAGLRSWQSPIKPFAGSFIVPLSTNVVFITNELYEIGSSTFTPASSTNYPEVGIQPLPPLGLQITNRLQVFILDGNRVIDYVQFAGPSSSYNINSQLADPDSNGDPKNKLYQWSTNFLNNNAASGIPYGVPNQITVSKIGPSAVPSTDIGQWDNTYGAEEVPHFQAFFLANHIVVDPATGVAVSNLDLQAQTPYTPTRTIVEYTSLQANDPLVHYMVDDLNFSGTESGNHIETGIHQWNNEGDLPTNTLGTLNDRYQPWGRARLAISGTDSSADNLSLQDPLVYFSDDWDFPSYKLPTIGWLGRVHRGTPWQTVYLKASDILKETTATFPFLGTNTWMAWTGNTNSSFDAANTAPTEDRLLFDLFTTALNDNATRGQLPVNVDAGDTNNPQAGLAAWSALFSGVMAISNSAPPSTFRSMSFPRPIALNNSAFPINPAGAAGTNSPLGQIVSQINQTRATFTNADGLVGAFEHIGDILAATNLTENSPFLNLAANQLTNGISDEMYEWLPQQTLSLLRVADSPRYVIYSYGQALKPAQNGIVTGGGTSFFGMATNYQVVAESATRAVVRFDSARVDNMYVTNLFGGPFFWTNTPSMTNNNAVIENFNVLPPD